MAVNNWWSDPLPPGWESKWDPGMNRYFFIDHSTKKTSWIDPRSPEGRQQVARDAPRQPTAQSYGGAYPMQAMNTVACSRCRIVQVARTPAGQMCASCKSQTTGAKCNLCNREKVAKQGDVCTQCMLQGLLSQQETSFNERTVEEPASPVVRADRTLVAKLQTSYPKAIESHIRAALESNSNSEAAACTDLERRGYKKVSPLELKTDELVPRLRPKYPGCTEELLRSTIASCNADEAKTMKKMRELGFLTPAEKSEQERQEREAKAKRDAVERDIRRDFPDVSSDLITLALQSADYNRTRAITLLKSMTSVEKKKAADQNKPTAAVRTADQPTASTSASGPFPVTPKKVSSPAHPSPTRQQAKVSKTEDHRQRPANKATTNQRRAAPASYTSKLAHGSDPSLAKGPQDSLLLKSYCDIAGPNPSIVHGPSCTVMGSQGATGPDASLVQGPSYAPRYQQTITVV